MSLLIFPIWTNLGQSRLLLPFSSIDPEMLIEERAMAVIALMAVLTAFSSHRLCSCEVMSCAIGCFRPAFKGPGEATGLQGWGRHGRLGS